MESEPDYAFSGSYVLEAGGYGGTGPLQFFNSGAKGGIL